MRRLAFRVPEAEKEAVLDAVLPLLPAGVREEEADGWVELSSTAGALPGRDVLETAAGRPLEGFAVEDVPADWRARRARFGGGGVLVRDRVLIRSPWDPPAPPGVVDVVVERRGSAFGSGSHPTTQMCVALMLDLEPRGGAADLGCGVGTLAIAAAKLGWAPVMGVDRVATAVEQARGNVARNGVEVACDVADLAVDAVPLAALLLVNAPPPVHERVAAALTPDVRHVIVSGIVAGEAEAVLRGYAAAGYAPAEALGTEDEWLALRLTC
jgi:ribosomal protein L11 methyltransferase